MEQNKLTKGNTLVLLEVQGMVQGKEEIIKNE